MGKKTKKQNEVEIMPAEKAVKLNPAGGLSTICTYAGNAENQKTGTGTNGMYNPNSRPAPGRPRFSST